jgi:hypothetical protein
MTIQVRMNFWRTSEGALRSKSKSKSKLCYDGQSIGHFFLVSSTHLGLTTRFFLQSDRSWFVDVVRPLWWEDGSVVYNCCWPSPAQSFSSPSLSPAQSFSGLSPTGLMTTFYSLTFETLPTWRTSSLYLYPPGTGWPSYNPRHCVPFLSPPTKRRFPLHGRL